MGNWLPVLMGHGDAQGCRASHWLLQQLGGDLDETSLGPCMCVFKLKSCLERLQTYRTGSHGNRRKRQYSLAQLEQGVGPGDPSRFPPASTILCDVALSRGKIQLSAPVRWDKTQLQSDIYFLKTIIIITENRIIIFVWAIPEPNVLQKPFSEPGWTFR